MTWISNDLADPAPQSDGISQRLDAGFGVEFGELRLAEVVSPLSHALDIIQGQRPGHAIRSCVIGMRIAEVLRLGPADSSALFYALLLKDLGGSNNAARFSKIFQADDRALKRAYRLSDWTDERASARFAFEQARSGDGLLARVWQALRIQFSEKDRGRELAAARCERGAELAAMLGLERATADAIRAVDEHWNGAGLPYGRRGDQIPLLARIAGLAQTVEVFGSAYGVEVAYEVVRARRRTWFDPALVNALHSFERDHGFWSRLMVTDQLPQLFLLEPPERLIVADEARLDVVAETFARVVDAKSPFTLRHSEGVAAIAVAIAGEMGASGDELVALRRAGLLHDIGKVSVSNLLLDKPAPLTDAEMAEMRKHTVLTQEILGRTAGFAGIASLAAAHHERLDGSGYHLGLSGENLPLAARVLAIAEIAEALSAARPYRKALPRTEVLAIIRKQVGTALDAEVFEVFAGMTAWAE